MAGNALRAPFKLELLQSQNARRAAFDGDVRAIPTVPALRGSNYDVSHGVISPLVELVATRIRETGFIRFIPLYGSRTEGRVLFLLAAASGQFSSQTGYAVPKRDMFYLRSIFLFKAPPVREYIYICSISRYLRTRSIKQNRSRWIYERGRRKVSTTINSIVMGDRRNLAGYVAVFLRSYGVSFVGYLTCASLRKEYTFCYTAATCARAHCSMRIRIGDFHT